jgi:NAD(P)-dependent dehydrogenase (short-subunit alcohol dehydrogenase family)/pimeloyl-ACP methyl ester carboxylesterase
MTAARHVTSTDGSRLAVYEAGTASCPVVLAIHGFPDDHTVWAGVLDRLGETMRVLSYDVRGAGASDAPPDTKAYRLPQLVDDLFSVLDELAPGQPVHLLAHDWGSVQAWAALADPRADGRIASLTSLSGPSLEQAAAWLRRPHLHPVASARQIAHSYYTLLFQLPALPEAAIRAGVLERTVGERSRSDQLNGLNLYRANLRGALGRPRPRHIDVPVQVIAPRDDPYIRPETATEAPVPYVRNLRTRVIPGGHWVIATRPDVIAECVREFIAHVEGAPETRALARARHRGRGGFDKQLVLVTGGARGIGRATALEFARHGADVVIADVNDVAAKDTVRALGELGIGAWSYHLDVSDAAAWDEFAGQLCAEHGVPDIVVNNAGIGMSGPLLSTSVGDWERVLGVNLWGVIHGSRLFGAKLAERGHGGHIVNIASAAAFSPSVTLPAYATTKAAVLMLTECLRAELAGEGIGVTAICPGFVDSDITRSTVYVGTDEASQAAMREHAADAYRRRNYTPDRVARQIVRAVERDTPVAAVTIEAKVLHALGRYAPPLARRFAKIDLNNL